MKKSLLCTILICFVLVCGCVNRESKKIAEETKKAVSAQDYKTALKCGEQAIEKGYDKEDFVKLVENLRNYDKAEIALKACNVAKAKEYIKKIDNTSESSMNKAVDKLNEDIVKIEDEQKVIDEKTNNLQKEMENGKCELVINGAKPLFNNQYISAEQKTEVGNLIEKAEKKFEEKIIDLQQKLNAGEHEAVINDAKTLLTNQYISDEQKAEIISCVEKSEKKLKEIKSMVGVYLLEYDQCKGQEKCSTMDRRKMGMEMTAYFFEDGRGYTIPGAGLEEFTWGNGMIKFGNAKMKYSFVDNYLVWENIEDGSKYWYNRVNRPLGEYPTIDVYDHP